jgi:hypothetical protein
MQSSGSLTLEDGDIEPHLVQECGMLDAFVQKGIRSILLTRGAERKLNQNEDAITSMVFSPISFMSPDQAFKCLNAILPCLRTKIGERHVKSIDVSFWPLGGRAYSIKLDKMTPVVPDLKVTLSFESDPPLVLVGEMKWDAPITNEQIKRERESVNGEDAYIFAIVKNKGKHTADKLKCDALYSWKDVHSNIDPGRFEAGSPSRRWACLVTKFLHLAEQLIFSGFDIPNVACIPQVDKEVIFFKEKPFLRFNWTFPEVPPLNAHIFYRGK